MRSLWHALVHLLSTALRRRVSLQLEIVALRHQLSVYERTDRSAYPSGQGIAFSGRGSLGCGPCWRQALRFVRPRTVLEWQRRRFRDHWRGKSQAGRPGRPAIDPQIRELIRRISRANPSWGSPRIVGELAKLGVEVAKSTVEKYRVRSAGPPSPTWRAFLDNHLADLLSIDFFVVPTVKLEVLYVLVVVTRNLVRTETVNARSVLSGGQRRRAHRLAGGERRVQVAGAREPRLPLGDRPRRHVDRAR